MSESDKEESDTEDDNLKKRVTRGGGKKKSFRDLGKNRESALIRIRPKWNECCDDEIAYLFQLSLTWTPPQMKKIPMFAQFVVTGTTRVQWTTRTE